MEIKKVRYLFWKFIFKAEIVEQRIKLRKYLLLPRVKLEISKKMLSFWGDVNFNKGLVRLSYYFLIDNKQPVIEKLITHELAHLVTIKTGHHSGFYENLRKIRKKIGLSSLDVIFGDVIVRTYVYEYICTKCKKQRDYSFICCGRRAKRIKVGDIKSKFTSVGK